MLKPQLETFVQGSHQPLADLVTWTQKLVDIGFPPAGWFLSPSPVDKGGGRQAKKRNPPGVELLGFPKGGTAHLDLREGEAGDAVQDAGEVSLQVEAACMAKELSQGGLFPLHQGPGERVTGPVCPSLQGFI